jgi:hypothetical protein
MRLKRIAIVVVVACSLGLASAAAAKKTTYAPPGKAGTSEYAETLPAAGGNVSPPAIGGGNPTGAELAKLGSGKAGADKLSKLGKAGQSAAAFARATAPARASAPVAAPATRSSSSTAGDLTGGSALNGLLHLIGGSDAGGIGVFLPLLLAFGLGAAVAFGAVRVLRRRQSPV